MGEVEIPQSELLRSYGAVLQGALKRRAELVSQISGLDGVIENATLSRAAEPGKPRQSLADRCEAALREADRPLSISDLPLGPSGSKRTRFVTLYKEKRFEHTGKGMWALREWPDEMKPRLFYDPGPNPAGLAGTAIAILRTVSKPLHAKEIAERMAQAGRAAPHRKVTHRMADWSKGNGIIESLGKNMWALREWSEEIKAPHRSKG